MKPKILQILIVEGQGDLSLLTKKYFLKHKMEIISVNNLKNLLDRLKNQLPDCLIVDLLATNNICYLMQKLKSNEKTQHIPTIFLTSKALSQDRIIGYDLGCSAYVSKPFHPEELHSIIKSLIKSRQLSLNFMLKNYVEIRRIKTLVKEKIFFSDVSQTKLLLTKQESSILKRIIKGQTIDQIQLELKTTSRNIEKYLTRLFDKTGVVSIKELKNLPWKDLWI